MSHFVIDANVPIVANGKSEQADPDCVIACAEILEKIHENGVVLLDDSMLILTEYMKNLNLSGQPGLGDIFMKWIWQVQANPRYCKQIHISQSKADTADFDEFPDDPRLKTFDHSDRKYVAVAISSKCKPEILNAVDSDWAEHFDALNDARIRIRFICPQHVCPRRK
jgi:hypothetical protein